MSLPEPVRALLGRRVHETGNVVAVETGPIRTYAAAVQDANPRYWSETDPIAPPAMVSAWFQPHPWEPGSAEPAVPLALHFEVKALLGYPAAVMTGCALTFFAPVRPGDSLTSAQRLVAVGEERATRLGTGRSWEIDVEYTSELGAPVASERWTAFGYRSERS